MVFTDLDGTLLDSHYRLSAANRRVLEALGELRIPRIIATGRSLASARTVIDGDFPIDFLVFATGAGILDWKTQSLIACWDLGEELTAQAVAAMCRFRLDFMIHHAVPDNHRFLHRAWGRSNPDFERRLARHAGSAAEWDGALPVPFPVSQLLAIQRAGEAPLHDEVAHVLPGCNVVRATSPLDHASTWIEIFPATVSKAHAAEWLAVRTGAQRGHVVAVGNDWNDTGMLDWAGTAYVVRNAPADLRTRYPVVGSNDEDGFSQAIREALQLPAD